MDIARTKLSAVQAQTFSSEGTVTSLEEALADRDKQINQLREQRGRAEKDVKEEKVLANILLNKETNIGQLFSIILRNQVQYYIPLFTFTYKKDLHERELTDYKMKIHSLESEVDKLQVRQDKAMAEKDKLEAKLEYSQSELGKSKAELDKVHGDSSSRYTEYSDWRQKFNKAEMEVDHMR